MLIGLAVLQHVAPLQASVSSWVITFCLGRLSDNLQSHVPVRKLSTKVLPMQLQKPVGYAISFSKCTALSAEPQLYIVTTSVQSISRPILFNIYEQNTLRLTYILWEKKFKWAMSKSFTYRRHLSMQISSQRDCLLLYSQASDPALASRSSTLRLREGVSQWEYSYSC